jgi:hypothetical protein
MHTVAHENSFEGSDKECLTEHMYALDRPGERGEVAADDPCMSSETGHTDGVRRGPCQGSPSTCSPTQTKESFELSWCATTTNNSSLSMPLTLPKPKKHKTKKKLDLVNTVEQLTWQV